VPQLLLKLSVQRGIDKENLDAEKFIIRIQKRNDLYAKESEIIGNPSLHLLQRDGAVFSLRQFHAGTKFGGAIGYFQILKQPAYITDCNAEQSTCLIVDR